MVHPADFDYRDSDGDVIATVRLDRDADYCKYDSSFGAEPANSGSFSAALPPGDDPSPDECRDDDPRSSGGSIFDIDWPGDPLYTAALNQTLALRVNFKEYAGLWMGKRAVAMVSPATSFYVAVAVAYNDPGAAGLMDQWNFTWQNGTNDNALQAGQGLGPESLYIGTAPMPGDSRRDVPRPVGAHRPWRRERAIAGYDRIGVCGRRRYTPPLPCPRLHAFPAFVRPPTTARSPGCAEPFAAPATFSALRRFNVEDGSAARARTAWQPSTLTRTGIHRASQLRGIAAAGDAAVGAGASPSVGTPNSDIWRP